MNTNFSFDDMYLFLEVVENKGFLKTANKLKLSQSTISRRMIKLESDLTCKLFIHDGRYFQLTESGKVLYNVLRKRRNGFNEIESIVECIKAQENQHAGTLKIVLPVLLSEEFITPHIIEFAKKYPNIKLEINHLYFEINIIERDVDIALINYIPKVKTQKFVKMFSYKLKLYCTRKYAAKYGVPQTIDELANHFYIGGFHTDGTVVREIKFTQKETLEVKTFKLESQITVDNKSNVLILLSSNEAIVASFEHIINFRDDIIEVLPDYEITNLVQNIYLTMNPYKNQTIARLFIDFLKSKFQNQWYS